MIQNLTAGLLALFLFSGCQSSSEKKTNSVETKLPEAKLDSIVTSIPSSTVIKKALPSRKRSFPKIDSLKGSLQGRVKLLLGAPDFVRVDKPAQLWQYRHRDCCIDLFFYPNINGAMKLNFLDFRTFGTTSINRQSCFVKILQTKASASNFR